MLNKTQTSAKLRSKENTGAINIRNILKEPFNSEKFANGELTSNSGSSDDE